MSEFEDMIAEGAQDVLDECGTDIVCGKVTKKCVLSPLMLSKAMRESGLWEEITATAELTRTDFTALGIVDRAEITVGGKKMKVMLIEDDRVDPCVRLQLKPAH